MLLGHMRFTVGTAQFFALGKNLSTGYFVTAHAIQGTTYSVGPSIGPPINASTPINNACAMASGNN
jgi:hypothetical protein